MLVDLRWARLYKDGRGTNLCNVPKTTHQSHGTWNQVLISQNPRLPLPNFSGPECEKRNRYRFPLRWRGVPQVCVNPLLFFYHHRCIPPPSPFRETITVAFGLCADGLSSRSYPKPQVFKFKSHACPIASFGLFPRGYHNQDESCSFLFFSSISLHRSSSSQATFGWTRTKVYRDFAWAKPTFVGSLRKAKRTRISVAHLTALTVPDIVAPFSLR